MWFDIIGTTLGFIGSIIFSAALIKSKDQIRDENESYWDANPYTTKAALTSQPYFIIAFVLLISGFAVVLGGKLGFAFADGSTLVSVLFASSISLLGYLLTSLLFIRKSSLHQKDRIHNAKNIFVNALRTYTSEMKGMKDDPNNVELFKSKKQAYQKDLMDKARDIPETDNEAELWAAREVDGCTVPSKFVEVGNDYLNKHGKV